MITLQFVACGRAVEFVDPQATTDPTDTTGSDTTVVLRGALAVTVAVAAQDTSIATAIGFPGTFLAGASVTARRAGQPVQAGATDSSGQVRFEGLVTGPWVVSAVRPLSSEERALLPSGAEDVTAFAGGLGVAVEAVGSSASIAAAAGRGGSVVISEVFPPNVPTDGNSYDTGQYLELVNNGFEDVYLDGMVVGFSYGLVIESNVLSCDEATPFREDSLGVWARYFASFPGTGSTYPLGPGRSVVIATDAIDHREFVPQLLDLSGANFEFIGSADVNNPAVPDMLNTGLAEWLSVVGHGLKFGFTSIGVFVARALDPDTLPRAEAIPGQEHVRIPREGVLDVFTTRLTPERQAGLPSVLCPRMTHPVFDQQSALLLDGTQITSIRRRILGSVGGRTLLLRTRNSRVDFEIGPPTPGSLP